MYCNGFPLLPFLHFYGFATKHKEKDTLQERNTLHRPDVYMKEILPPQISVHHKCIPANRNADIR